MYKDNIINIKQAANLENEPITLMQVKESLNAWRATKKNQQAPVPKSIWDNVRLLLTTYSEQEILSALDITRTQLDREKNIPINIACEKLNTTFSDDTNLVFCEVDLEDQIAYPLDSKPAQAFATNTSVVELYRPDGMLMKIHICTDRFEELLDAFYKGCTK